MLKLKNAKNASISFLTIILALVFIFPFAICILMAIKSPSETVASLTAIPTSIYWQNFIEAIEIMNFTSAFSNSFILMIMCTFFITICSAMGAYVIARNPKVMYLKVVDSMLIMALMIPFHVIMIPIYKIMKALGLMNTLVGAAIVIIGMALPFATFLYIGYFKSVPIDLEEASRIDGCGMYRTFWQIVFPLVKPITATVVALEMLWTWNEFNVSLIMLQKDVVKTIPIKQYYFFGEYVSEMNMAFAAAIMSMIPIVIFFTFSQKYIQKGLVAGAVKG